MGCGGSSNAGGAATTQQQQQQKWTDQAVKGIDTAYSGFTPSFYQNVGQAYQNYAMPQVQQQYQNSADQLGFKMTGQGLANSSAAQTGQQGLNTAMTKATQQVGNQAVDQENKLQQQVAQEKSGLYQQAQMTSNPSQLYNQALAQAQISSAPSTFQPIGNMFDTFGQMYLANKLSNTYGNYANTYLNQTNNPGLYSLLGASGNSQALPSAANYGY